MKSDHKIQELESVFAEKQLFHLPQACIPARTYPPCLENTRHTYPPCLETQHPTVQYSFLCSYPSMATPTVVLVPMCGAGKL